MKKWLIMITLTCLSLFLVACGGSEAKVADLTEGKKELEIGKTYTTAEGMKFEFQKAEITENDSSCMFNLYIISEKPFTMGDVKYESRSGYSIFGLAHQSSDKFTHRYAGGFLDRDDLESDAKKYGILSFTIEEEEYYIPIQTFFEEGNTASSEEGGLHCEEVELTVDNWDEYFEVREHSTIHVNGFNEYSGIQTYAALINKDGIKIDMNTANVTIEYTCNIEYKPFSVDFENSELNYGETTSTVFSDATIATLGNVGQYVGEYTHDRYGVYIPVGSWSGNELEGKDARQIAEFEITRISGTIAVLYED